MHCYARYLFIGIIAVLGFGNMLTGCGSKGELYMPENSPSATDRQPIIEPRKD